VKQGNTLVPTFTAFAVVQLLERFFARLVDIGFTASMEDDLDAISLGEKKALPYLQSFYFGNDDKVGLRQLIQSEIDPRESCTIFLSKDSQGRDINIRVGRYGPYLERGDERASIPVGMAPDELTLEKAEELLARKDGPQELGRDPETGKAIYLKKGRYGPYVQLGENGEQPKLKSLLSNLEPEEVTQEIALKLLSLPRSLGTDPETGEPILADFGRYGPYIRRGSDTRRLSDESEVFEVTLEKALELLKAEKPAAGWRARLQPKVLKELGEHGEEKTPIRLLTGRYGPYVTDGKTNAAIPRGRSPEEFTLDEAVELIEQRARQKAEGGRRTKKKAKAVRKKAAKKTPSKKTTSKKTTSKSTSKSTAKKASGRRGRAKATKPAQEA
jgi:DNA topoisomerase-1